MWSILHSTSHLFFNTILQDEQSTHVDISRKDRLQALPLLFWVNPFNFRHAQVLAQSLGICYQCLKDYQVEWSNLEIVRTLALKQLEIQQSSIKFLFLYSAKNSSLSEWFMQQNLLLHFSILFHFFLFSRAYLGHITWSETEKERELHTFLLIKSQIRKINEDGDPKESESWFGLRSNSSIP